jgi:phosphatidylglycerophosphate synthase
VTTTRQGSLLSAETRTRLRGLAQPMAVGLGRLGLTPNLLTVLGFLVSCGAAALAALGLWLPAAVVSLIGGSFDMFDGALARATGRTSRFGAFLDSTFDRWGEAVVYAGVATGAVIAGSALTTLLAALAMASAFMVSYTRARAEAAGFHGEVGIAPRPERLIVMAAGLGAAGLTGGPSPWLDLALGVIFALSTITVIQRIDHVRRQAAKEEPTL